MDDKPTNEEPKKDFNKLDLTQLESFSFGTEWTKEKPQPGGGSNRRDDRPRRGGPTDDRRDRRGFKRSAGPVPGGGAGPGGGRDRRQGGARPGRGDGHGQRQGHEDRRGGGERRGGGDRRGGGRPMHDGPYISPHFEATFYPEDVSFAALAKTIRSSARTFELFDIAKTVIGKHDRFVVVLDRKSGKPQAGEEKKPFHVCLLDGMPFETEEAAINHVVQNHIARFFNVTQEEGEPPKGSFQVINRCGVTGELLGPPNYHLYTQIVQQHHASRLPRMSFENFSHRIESVRDEEVVAQWLESMKTITRYTWLGDENVPSKPDEAASADAPAESAADAPTEPTAEATAEEAPKAEAPASESVAPEASGADESAESPVEEAPVAEEAPAAAAPVPVDQLTFDSISEAKVHLITKAREKCVRTYEHGRFHGRIIAGMPDGEVKRAVLGALERQQRFPVDTDNALRGRLRREGFTIFKKGSKGISYVSAVKRKFRVAGQTFSDSINDLITFVEQNPMVKVSELTEKFLQIAPPEAPKSEGEAPTATTPGTVSPFAETDQPRIKRMQVDLRWLVTEGYVTEFIDGTLFAAPPMPPAKPKPEPKPKSEPKADAPATATELAPADAPAAPAEAEATPAPVAAEIETPAAPTETPAAVESGAEPEVSPAIEETSAPEAEVEAAPTPETAAAPEVATEPAPEVAVEPDPVAAPAAAPEPESAPAAEIPAPEPSAAPEPQAEETPAAEVEAESSDEAAAPTPDEDKEKPQS